MNSFHFYRHNNNNNNNNNNYNNKNNINNNNNNKSHKNRNILSNTPGYFTANVKDPEYKCSLNYNLHENNYLQRSFSADNVVIRSRGFKPSDIRDPAKRHFLENLTTKILHVDMEGGETKRIDLQKLLTPANDSEELLHAKNKKMYASSYFYAPSHPTVEDQVELARRISHSLSDVKNLKSKGQSMYVNRKKRSVKWIHDGNGLESDEETETTLSFHKDKIPLKCMMNPNGKVLDIHGIQALGEEVNIEERPSHPEKLFDIVRDLNNQKGRGAEIFAKRRKRSEKWVVEKDQSQATTQPSGIPWKTQNPRNNEETDVKENSALPPLGQLPLLPPLNYAPKSTTNNTCRPFYNPFTLDLSLEPVTTPAPGHGNGFPRYPPDMDIKNVTGNGKMKKIKVRAEIAVDPDLVEYLPLTTERAKKQLPIIQQEDYAKKSKRNSGVKRKTMEHHLAIDPRPNPNRNKPHKGPLRGNPCNAHPGAYNGGIPQGVSRFGKIETESEEDEDDDDDEDKNEYEQCGDGVESEYTPVPVKQLIKEFEKTCRPVMQYKQIDPSKVAPQLCAFDNEMISRYFEGRAYANSSAKHEEDAERVNNSWNMNTRLPVAEEQLVSFNCTRDPGPGAESRFSISRGVQRENNVPEDSRQRDWRLKYIDDEDSSSSEDSSDTTESNTRSLSTLEENDAYYRYPEFVSSEFTGNGDCRVTANGKEDHKDVEVQIQAQGQGPIDPGDKSLVLAMVASEEDILQTIKHLRRTPVLSNLLPTDGSPDFSRFNDMLPEVGNKLFENSEYQGPKLNSYQKLSNYNTAPRGWDQTHTYYRPITFGRPQETTVYSDF